jgi:murein DD-endopeptidase MepM/ murein hydrolase activator NlpD
MSLLVGVAWNLVPQGFEAPAMLPLSAESGVSETLASYSRLADAEGYLEGAVLPATMRPMRSIILPLSAPQREVRTAVMPYTVQPYDTVYGIAMRFGLQPSSLVWANAKLEQNPDLLSLGQELNILPVDGVLHTVAAGETLSTIAARYKVEATTIQEYVGNTLEPSHALSAGQQLIVPGGVKAVVQRAAVATTNTAARSAAAPASAARGSGQLVWPMAGRLSQGYHAYHQAIDLAAPIGTPIYAADAGYIASSQWTNTGYGRMLIVDHGNGFRTLYAHMNSFAVEVGQSVGRGQVIGYSGNTGRSTGPHLHFEVILNGVRRNPFTYLP